MTELLLTEKAAKKLFSAQAVLVVTSPLVKPVRAIMPPEITIGVLEDSGLIRLIGEKPLKSVRKVPLSGLPANLWALVCGSKKKPATAAFLEFIVAVKAKRDVAVLSVKSGLPIYRNFIISRRLVEIQYSLIQHLQQAMGARDRRLVALRDDVWQAKERLKQADLMLNAIGYDTSFVSVDLPPGQRTMGPKGTISVSKYSQLLPVSCAGLEAISLYVVDADLKASVSSYLEIGVYRAADNKALFSQRVSQASLRPGWNNFVMSDDASNSLSDALLTLVWHKADDLQLAVSDTVPDRFGHDDQVTLSLQTLQGVGLPGSMKIVAEDQKPCLRRDMERVSVKVFPEVSGTFSFYAGYEAHEQLCNKYQFPIFTQNGETRVVQLHPLSADTSACLYRGAIPADAYRLACKVGTAHVAAPPFIYVMMAISPDVTDTNTMIETICSRVNGGELSGQNNDATWNSLYLQAKEKRFLDIDFRGSSIESRAESFHLAMAVLPVDNDTSYGWCRWHNLVIYSNSRSDVPENGA